VHGLPPQYSVVRYAFHYQPLVLLHGCCWMATPAPGAPQTIRRAQGLDL